MHAYVEVSRYFVYKYEPTQLAAFSVFQPFYGLFVDALCFYFSPHLFLVLGVVDVGSSFLVNVTVFANVL